MITRRTFLLLLSTPAVGGPLTFDDRWDGSGKSDRLKLGDRMPGDHSGRVPAKSLPTAPPVRGKPKPPPRRRRHWSRRRRRAQEKTR